MDRQLILSRKQKTLGVVRSRVKKLEVQLQMKVTLWRERKTAGNEDRKDGDRMDRRFRKEGQIVKAECQMLMDKSTMTSTRAYI